MMNQLVLYAEDYRGHIFEILSRDCVYYARLPLSDFKGYHLLAAQFRLFEDACNAARWKIEEMN